LCGVGSHLPCLAESAAQSISAVLTHAHACMHAVLVIGLLLGGLFFQQGASASLAASRTVFGSLFLAVMFNVRLAGWQKGVREGLEWSLMGGWVSDCGRRSCACHQVRERLSVLHICRSGVRQSSVVHWLVALQGFDGVCSLLMLRLNGGVNYGGGKLGNVNYVTMPWLSAWPGQILTLF
jgi:hypothetical protein